MHDLSQRAIFDILLFLFCSYYFFLKHKKYLKLFHISPFTLAELEHSGNQKIRRKSPVGNMLHYKLNTSILVITWHQENNKDNRNIVFNYKLQTDWEHWSIVKNLQKKFQHITGC